MGVQRERFKITGMQEGCARTASMMGGLLVLWMCVSLMACSAPVEDPSPTPTPTFPPDADSDAPVIVLDAPTSSDTLGQAVEVAAVVSDPSGISSVALLYRAPGTDFWGSTFMAVSGEPTEDPSGARWVGSIPSTFVQPPGVEFYVRAVDASPNRNEGFAPAQGPTGPAYLEVLLPGQDFPYASSFEPADIPPEDWTLDQTGWTEYVAGFNDYLNWELTPSEARTGGFSAFHGHGSPFQTGDFDDYLVSPALDFSTISTESSPSIDLYWFEMADLGQYAEHSVLVSTGSPDPADEQYQEVIALLDAPPELELGWGRSRHVDLSAFAGESQVYVAFRYKGLWGDDWYLDDVVIEAPRADLRFAPANIVPTGIQPGETAQLSLTLLNDGLTGSLPLTVTVSSTDSSLDISPQTLSITTVPANDQLLAGPVALSVPADHATNLYIPLEINATDGERSWTTAARLRVGNPAVAHIEITHAFEDDLILALGYGDPEAPTYLTTIQADEGGDNSGTFTWDVDISAQVAALPPNYDTQRWFVKVMDDSVVNTGTVDAFWIDFADERFTTEGLPQPIPDDQTPLFVFLPGKPLLEVRQLQTMPEVLAPGSKVSFSVVINNRGAPPVGTVTGTLSSTDPDVLSLSGGPIPFAYTALTSSRTLQEDPTPTPSPTPEPTPDPNAGVFGILSSDKAFTFTVSNSHVDSSPLDFTLTLKDDEHTVQLPLQLSVPYPVLGGLALTIEDPQSTVKADEALNPSESAFLRLRLRNGGELATFGPVSVSMKVVADGDGLLTLTSVPIPLLDDGGSGVLEPGEGGKSAQIPLSLTGGKSGDTIRIELVMSDGVVSRTETRALQVDQVPFNPITIVTDPEGDSQGSPADLAYGFFKRQGNLLTLRWQSHTAFDMTSAPLYAYLASTAGYQYAIYADEPPLFLVWIPSGETGYWSKRYTLPSSLVVQQIDDYTVQASINLADLSLTATPLFGGASVDNCGGAVGCDYAPNSVSLITGQTRFWW